MDGGDIFMNEECWSVKRNAYACICITPDFHGTAIIWNTKEEALEDAKERVKDFIEDNSKRFGYRKVEDGYEIINKCTSKIIRYYKIFEVQELE